MQKVTVVIPNYNGKEYLPACLTSLSKQTVSDFITVVVDNNSSDGSADFIRESFPEVELIELEENTGFSGAVNAGIKAAESPYVILLNNDTETAPEFVERLCDAIEEDRMVFSVGAKMLSMKNRNVIDDAGDFYTVLGWAFARGKGAPASRYVKKEEIFSACAGAAIYRKDLLEELKFFDEAHFAYLEDLDIGLHARICGYSNRFEPSAIVYHAGSAASGSRYNKFKVTLSAQNSIYVQAKNLSLLQLILHFPIALIGVMVKLIFFALKGFGGAYLKGVFQGIRLSACKNARERRVHFRYSRMKQYLKIEWELWKNLFLLVKYR